MIKFLFWIFIGMWFYIPYKILQFIFMGTENKKCVWCGNKYSVFSNKLKFVEGYEGEPVWEFRNVDGSRDKRSIDNFTRSRYFSRFKCTKEIELENGNKFTCNAVTDFTHQYEKKPNQYTQVYKGVLAEEGQGQRTSSDFKTNYAEIDISSENRKNS